MVTSDDEDPVVDRRPGKGLQQGRATFIRLSREVDPLDAIEVVGPLVTPCGGARDAECGEIVVPQRVAVGLAFVEGGIVLRE